MFIEGCLSRKSFDQKRADIMFLLLQKMAIDYAAAQ